MKVQNEIKNDLLKRKEVKLVIDSSSNPGFAAVKKQVAEHFKSEEDKVVVRSVGSSFGSNEFLVDAVIYNTAGDREKFERKPKVKKKAGEAAAK